MHETERMKPTVWHHLRLCTHGHPDETIDDAAIVVDETGTIRWLGAFSALPQDYAHWQREDLHGAWVTPGLVDCHTHLVYGGTRADEFAQRLAGVSYEEIARQGGGIVSTVRATRAADETALFVQAAARLQPLLAEGVTAIEIKSGYGLDLASERKMLRVARQLGERFPSPSTRPSSARMRCRPNMRGAPTHTSTTCASGCCRRSPTKGWSTRSTCSASASVFRSRRPSACSTPRRDAGCR
jgi:imidazolonepropionase